MLCERRAIRFVDIGKNEEKVRRYIVRQIGICLRDLFEATTNSIFNGVGTKGSDDLNIVLYHLHNGMVFF